MTLNIDIHTFRHTLPKLAFITDGHTLIVISIATAMNGNFRSSKQFWHELEMHWLGK